MNVSVFELIEMHQLQKIFRLFLSAYFGKVLAFFQPELDIFYDRKPGEKPSILKNTPSRMRRP
jgi:hypothetical protein